MKRILTIAILLFSMASYAQGNLQFNQVLTFSGTLQWGNSTGVLYTVPSGKTCKIEAMGLSGLYSTTALNINNDEYKYVKDVTIERINYKDNHEQIINICNIGSYMIRNKLDLLRDKDFTCEYLKQIHAKNLCSSGGTLKGINKNNSNYQKPESNDNINILKFNDYSSKYKLKQALQ